MEKLISKEYLNEFYYTKDTRYFSNSINKSKRVRLRNSYSFEVTVFLSHKHDEINVLERVVVLLRKLNVNVYVDWLDSGMPKNTSGYTAKRIKEKITSSRKFIFLATEGAINSKWCNWELGYGDAKKYPAHIAILPITDKRDNTWSGSEYLQIYPIITTDYNYTEGNYYVEFEDQKVNLVEWLKK